MRHTSHIRIDLNAIVDNLRGIRRMVPEGTEICSVVKADAYGLGASRVSRTLIDAGSRMLAVFTPAQAAEIEAVSGRTPVLVLMPTAELPRDPAISRMLAVGRLHLTVSDLAQAASLGRIRLGRPIPVHIEIDTGMGRGGVRSHEAPALIDAVRDSRSLRLEGIYTHFSSDDPETVRLQAERLDGVLKAVDPVLPKRVRIHAASTGPSINAPDQHRDLVRIGLGWTGSLPGDLDGSVALKHGLRGVVSWTSSVIHVRSIEAGESVGYGSRWISPRATRLGLIPVGYADGYPSACIDPANPHRVLIETREGLRAAPVVGTMNMDQLVIDLGDLDPSEPFLDREVVLLSEQSDSIVSLSRVASRAGLVPHQFLACLGANVPRIYLAEQVAVDPPGVVSDESTSVAAG